MTRIGIGLLVRAAADLRPGHIMHPARLRTRREGRHRRHQFQRFWATFGSDISWYGISKIVPAITGFIQVAFFIRAAGNVEYGYYTVLWAASTVIGNLGSGWIRQSSLRFSGDLDNAAAGLQLRTIAVTAVAVTGLAIPTVFLILPHLATDLRFLVIAVGMTTATAGQQVSVSLLQAQRRARVIAISESVRAFLWFAIGAAFLKTTSISGAEAIMASAVASSIPVTVINLWLLEPKVASRGSRETTKSWWVFGWPMSVWLTIATVLQFSDRILIQHINGAGPAGNYGAVYDAASRILVVCVYPVTMASHTLIMKHWNQDEGSKAKVLNRISILLQIAIFLPVLIIVITFRDMSVRFLLGQANSGMDGVVVPLLLGSFLWQLSLSAHKVLEVHKRTKVMVANVSICTAANVVGNLILLPHFGPPAAAWTTFAAALLYFILTQLSAAILLGSADDRWKAQRQLVMTPRERIRKFHTRIGAGS
jgi:O-antigen/teichoic acid export membrane protein